MRIVRARNDSAAGIKRWQPPFETVEVLPARWWYEHINITPSSRSLSNWQNGADAPTSATCRRANHFKRSPSVIDYTLYLSYLG